MGFTNKKDNNQVRNIILEFSYFKLEDVYFDLKEPRVLLYLSLKRQDHFKWEIYKKTDKIKKKMKEAQRIFK